MGKNHDSYTRSIFLTPVFLEIFISFWVDNKASHRLPNLKIFNNYMRLINFIFLSKNMGQNIV